MYTVYRHTSPSGKQYIGITSRPVNKRWNYGYGYQQKSRTTPFWNAIQKYGWDNIKHEIIYEGLTLEQATIEERRLIKELHTLVPGGYNVELGGVSEDKHTEETKRKISESHKGEKNPMWGKHPSPATLEKLRKRRVWNKKIINQYDENGNLVRSYPSASEAARQVDGDIRNISACAKGKRRIAYGYVWRYAGEEVSGSGLEYKTYN